MPMNLGHLVRACLPRLLLWMVVPLLSCVNTAEVSQTRTPSHHDATAVQASPLQVAKEPALQASNRSARATELVARIAPALSHNAEDLHAIPTANGLRTVNLQGRFHHALVAYVDGEGNIQYGCVDSAERAQSLLAGEATRAP